MKKRYFLIPLFIVCVLITCIAGYAQKQKYSTDKDSRQTAAPETVKPAETAESLLNKELTSAPELAGTKKVLQDNGFGKEVTYIAEKGNGYGVEANKFVGVYREKVTLDNKEVGGVALVPKVVKKLLNDSLKTNKWMMFVPADISEIKDKTTEVNLKRVDVPNRKTGKVTSKGALETDFDSRRVSISSPVLNGETKGILTTTYAVCFDNTILQGITLSQFFCKNLNQDGLVVYGYFKLPKLTDSKTVFGTKMIVTSSHIYELVQSKTGLGEIDDSHILKVGNSPVFMINN